MELNEKLDSNKMSAVQSFDMIVRSALIDHEDRIKRIEKAADRAGGTKHNCGENCHVHNPKPAPTPATVERFRVYRYENQVSNNCFPSYQKILTGEVVATRDNNGWWRLCFEPNKWSSVYSQEQYEWLVNMMLKSGAWEIV